MPVRLTVYCKSAGIIEEREKGDMLLRVELLFTSLRNGH